MIPPQLPAQGNLVVSPTRVVFEGKRQKELLYLINTGKDTAIYSISFIQYAMLEDGNFVTVEKSDSTLLFADSYLRIFPRKITLAPGESQTIIVQLRRSSNMANGEYRSHLYFRSEKDYTPIGMPTSSKDATLNVRLIPVFGVSIPIIIRTGFSTVTAELSDLRMNYIKDTIQNLTLTINRKGNISTYGDIKVEFIPQHGKICDVGLVRGIGVYTTTNRRFLSIQLKDKEKRILKNGRLKVQYISGEEGKNKVYAESELEI
jgi:hypothetical protein